MLFGNHMEELEAVAMIAAVARVRSAG